MKIIITPEYKDLFTGPQENISDLLADIPSALTIALMAMLNAELHFNDRGDETQARIFDMLLRRQPAGTRRDILDKAFAKVGRNRNEDVHFFSVLYNMNFLHHELTNFRDLPDIELTPEQELQVFKSYFLVVEEVNREYKSTLRTAPEFNDEYFARMTWPTLIDQFELNTHVHPYAVMVRGSVFFNYLQMHSEYSGYVLKYLQKHNKATALNYLGDIYQLLIAGHKKTQELGQTGWASFSISDTPGFETLLAQFCMDQKAYALQYGESKSNFSGIKSQPLWRYNKSNYLVLSWGSLSGKLYEGLVFDFFHQSGIKEHADFKRFTDFKRFVGEQITERYLSRKMLQALFKKKYGVLLFDEHEIAGFPDAYYRQGNTVVLFEIKDAYFPANAINSFSYDKIVAAIDQKVNNSGKGTGQFIKQLKFLCQKPYERSPGYKYARNLTVYPVIIYADQMFNMPGIDQYLAKSFCEKVRENELEKHFKKIKPLAFINLNFLMKYFDLLETSGFELTKLIDEYHAQVAAKKKRSNRTRDLNDHLHVYETFEQLSEAKLPADNPKREYVAETIRAFDLAEALPKE
ncbi:hypothetical protein [Mucilaginibacter rubeus]|uniref:hypothetical protein n=1 Tax=Mucilaginibacter rubeus TaxID=2027860 RepID=UPI0016635875|nr:hypothetical protein [Mucilaginibacter rubeus]GGA95943.1 hypothetical protein GCM10011500_09640 [Mucilaginibacter rubeus]